MDDAFNNAVEAYIRIGTSEEKETDKIVVDLYVSSKCLNHDIVRKEIESEAKRRINK